MSDRSEIERRLVLAAYEMGWRNACDDFIAQRKDEQWPIGRSKRADVGDIVAVLDPNNLLGLSGWTV